MKKCLAINNIWRQHPGWEIVDGWSLAGSRESSLVVFPLVGVVCLQHHIYNISPATSHLLANTHTNYHLLRGNRSNYIYPANYTHKCKLCRGSSFVRKYFSHNFSFMRVFANFQGFAICSSLFSDNWQNWLKPDCWILPGWQKIESIRNCKCDVFVRGFHIIYCCNDQDCKCSPWYASYGSLICLDVPLIYGALNQGPWYVLYAHLDMPYMVPWELVNGAFDLNYPILFSHRAWVLINVSIVLVFSPLLSFYIQMNCYLQ